MLSRITVLSAISAVALAACATPQENPFYKHSTKYQGTPTSLSQAPAAVQTAPISYETASYETGQSATYTRVNHECLKKEKNRELLGAGLGGTIGAIAGKKLIGGTKGTVIGAGLGGAAGYGIGDKAVNCDPQPVPVQQISTTSPQPYTSAPTVTASYGAPVIAKPYVSPTDTEFASISETGTPGYQVMQAQTVEIYDAPITSSTTPNFQNSSAQSGAQEVSYDYTANTISASTDTAAIPSETRILARGYSSSHIVKQGDTVYSLSRKHCVGIADIQSLNNLDAGYSINIGDQLRLPASNC